MQTLPPVDALQVWFALLRFPFHEAKTIQQASHVLKKQVQRLQTQQRIRKQQQFHKLRLWRPVSHLVTLGNTEQLNRGKVTRLIIDENSTIKQLQMLVYKKIKENRDINQNIRYQIRPLTLQIDVDESIFQNLEDYVNVADTFVKALNTPIDVQDGDLWLVDGNSVLFQLKPFYDAIRLALNWNFILDFNVTLPDHLELFRFDLQDPIPTQDANIIKDIIHDTISELFPI